MIHCLESASIPFAKVHRTDTEIQLAIRLEQRLQHLMQITIRAHVCAHQLQLFGIVESWHEKQQVQEIARALAPEYRICNELRVMAD